jgi:hypothetical protein
MKLQVLLLGILCPTLHAPGAARPSCRVEPPSPGPLRALVSEPTQTTGISRLLFLRVRFPDDIADPITLEKSQSTLAEVDALFRSMSQGVFGLTSTVSAVIALGKPRETYNSPGGFDRLLDDARSAGIDAGFDYRDYDLEVVRHSGVSSFAGGNARLGTRGAQVQADGAVLLVHEIGHNLGLSHANFWNTSGPGIANGSPPLPSNLESHPDPRSIDLHPDSVVGHDTGTGPGNAMEYGDPWDIMGSGDSDFHGTYKAWLKWLPNSVIAHPPTGRSTHRLHPSRLRSKGVVGRACASRVPARALRVRAITPSKFPPPVLAVPIPKGSS